MALGAVLTAAALVANPTHAEPPPPPPSAQGLQPTESETVFLDRLMIAESGGRENAKNPRSSALGPFQFLSSTFLDLMARHFAATTGGKTDVQILQLRTDHQIARNAALVYTRENAAFLIERGLEASAAHLRLAFLVGPYGAARVIGAEPETPVTQLLSSAALEANPFMNRMTARQLLDRSADDAAGVRLVTLPIARSGGKKAAAGGVRVRCNLGRPSCRKWLALANVRQQRRSANPGKTASGADDGKKN